MPSVLECLISKFDGIGWIPTIRGCLSLDLIDNAKNILGDVDKYSIRFKYPNGLRSEHYLIASSILTTNDTKAGAGYIRTFRYIFTGSINNGNVVKAFLEEKNLLCDTNLQNYIHDEGLLIGLIFRNCVLEKKRFSRWYDLTIYFNSCWMEPNEWLSKRRKIEVEYDYLSIVLYLIIIFLSIAAIAFIVWLLRGYITNNF